MLKHRHAIVFSLTRELLMLSIVLKTRRIRHCIGLMLLLGLTCMAQAQNSPASAAPTDQQALVGKVVFLELVTPDLMAAQRFYGGLLGWTFSEMSSGTVKYVEARADGQPVAALMQKELAAGAKRQPAWLNFIAVSDVDAAKAAALHRGAKLLLDSHTIPHRGRAAIFADPQGAVFAILASSSIDPADVLAAPGEWIWSSLLTRDPDAAAAFYQDVFGYEVFDLGKEGDIDHLMLSSGNFARASVNTLPSSWSKAHAHWLSYVRVENVAAAAQRAVTLGGQVLVAPHMDRHGGMLAVVSDPQGAPFGLLEWSEANSKEQTK